ncbi:MAG: ATP-binding protein [Porticoccaceae bacterium]|nr:ATP-binding protein [Porticoccaceae bacterium]
MAKAILLILLSMIEQTDSIKPLENKLSREIAARQQAEQLLEEKSRELYQTNQELYLRNQKIAEQSRHLQKQVLELQETRQQLVQSEKMAVIGQLAAGVAHEINNPVGFIASNLDTLRDYMTDLSELLNRQTRSLEMLNADGSSPSFTPLNNELLDKLQAFSAKVNPDYLLQDITQLIGDSIEGAERVRQIVADLSDFSYLTAPQVNAEDINSLLQKTINIASSELRYKADIELYLTEIPAVVCHAGKIGQVFINLLVNAAHAIKERGLITVSTGIDGELVWIDISDNGCGIPKQNLDKIFDPFFTTKEIGKGTGLGLHVVKGALEMHGGEIYVSSEEGCGASFRIVLPISGSR